MRAIMLLLVAGSFGVSAGVSAEDALARSVPYSTVTPRLVATNPSVAKEIGITERQRGDLAALYRESQAAELAVMRRVRDVPQVKRNAFLQEQMSRVREQFPPRLEKLLRPDQNVRLRQVLLQMAIQRNLQVLASERLVAALGITSDQVGPWQRLLGRQHQRLVDLFGAQRKAMGETKLALLSKEQRKQVEELYGAPYTNDRIHLDDVEDRFGLGPMLAQLRYASFRKELEVIDDQYEQIKGLMKPLFDQYRALTQSELAFDEDSEKYKKGLKRLAEMQAKEGQQLEKILLPHQMTRLKQLIFQGQVRRESASDPLRSPTFARMLGMTKAEHAILIKKLDEQMAAYRKETDVLQTDMLRTAIESLPREQRVKYYRLIGKPFEPTMEFVPVKPARP